MIPHRACAPSPCSGRIRSHGRVTPWLIGALLVLGGGGAAWWAWAAQREPAASAERAAGPGRNGGPGQGGGRRFGGGPGGGIRVQPVAVATVRQQDIRVTVSALGSIAAANIAVVKPKIEGELKAVHFREGQWVQAGAVLAELDARPAQIALAQAEGQLARDQAQLQNARVDLNRFRDLLAKDGIAKQQVDTQEALVRQLQGTVQADQAAVDNAKLQLSYTRIVAPIPGRVGFKQADLGNVVRPSDAQGLLSIAQTQQVNVVFAVPDVHLPQIQSQLKAGRQLPVEAWDREQKQRLALGHVTSIDNTIDVATSTIRLKAAFANAGGDLFPNQSVQVRLQLATLEGALAVPSAAVLRNGEGSFVYRVAEGGTVNARPVQTGPNDGDWVSVKGDLKAGDTVVTDGVDRLREGSQVEVIVPGAAPGASGPRGKRGGGPRGASAPGAAAPAA